MNQRQMTIKTFLIKLTLSTALISLPAQVNASMVVAKSDEYSDTSVALYKHHKYSDETICTHFHIPKSTQSVFDDPSNQGEGVVQFYETMITGFSFLEDSETPRVKTRGISRYKLRLPYVLHNVSYSPKT